MYLISTRKSWTVGVGPEEGHKSSQRAGAPLLSRKAEGAGVILEKLQLKGNLVAAFQYTKA